MKRLDIKTGYLCNNNCLFCVQADNKFKGNRDLDELKREITESKARCDEIVLTGGEVTLRKDFFELVRFCKETGYKTIQIQSNGRMFAYMDFCRRAVEAGATEFSIAIHGHNAELHDSLTRSKGSFDQSIQAVRNLRSLKTYVMTNTVVVQQNHKFLPEIAQLLVDLGVHQFQLAFVHPIGNAWNNFDTVVPKMSEVVPYLKKALEIGIDNNVRVMAEAMPYCMMQGYEAYVSELALPDTEIKYSPEEINYDYKYLRVTYGKAKFLQCAECKHNLICEGPWREYPEKMGEREFIPVLK